MLSMYMLVSGEWNMSFLIGLMIIACLYGSLLSRFTAIKLYHKQPIFFFTGLLLVYVTMGSPLSTISHLSFSFHMFFMSIHYFIIPPLLLLGIPYPFFQQMDKKPWIKKLCFPSNIALYTFALLFFSYHLQITLNLFSQYPTIHTSYMVLMFYLSFIIWWPLLSPHQYSKVGKKAYAFKSSLLIMPACFFFIFSGILGGIGSLPLHTELNATLCLPSNFSPSDLLPFPFNSRIDQSAAGILMIGMHKFGMVITKPMKK